MAYSHKEVLFKNKRKWLCYVTYEPWKHYANWRKPVIYCLIPFIWNVQNTQVHRERKSSDFPGREKGEQGVIADGDRISFGSDENVLELDGGDGCCTALNKLKDTGLYIVKFCGMRIISQ